MSAVAVRAAGAVLWRDAAGGAEVALVHRPRYDDWSFPKGKLEPGETMPFAAVREVCEETGQRVRLGPVLGEVRYAVPEGPKVVGYWSAQARGGVFQPGAETDELVWLSPAAAARRLSYPHDLDVLRRFEQHGCPASTILLVRHAKAGSRDRWDGDDDLRPLSPSGREQAAQLARLMVLFGPDRLHSALPLRCRDTLVPLAQALGGPPVAGEPLLGEAGYWADPDAGLARLRAVARMPGVTVVCSQGGVIPDVVAALAGSDPTDVPARKGSTWVLGFSGGALRSADYYPHPTG